MECARDRRAESASGCGGMVVSIIEMILQAFLLHQNGLVCFRADIFATRRFLNQTLLSLDLKSIALRLLAG